MKSKILGVSCYYHDSAAALIIDGEIVSAVQEERFTRIKHDANFPVQSIKYCLESQCLTLEEIDYVVFYDKPLIKFERLLETYLSYAPKGLLSFISAMPVWLKEKLFLKQNIKKELQEISGLKGEKLPKLMFTQHHQSHAASAFYPSPFHNAAVLCMDGVGEWVTTSIWIGEGAKLKPIQEINFPHSIGMLYSAFTYYAGFKVNSGEYKLMGLAPYGEPIYAELINQKLIDVKQDGSFSLDMSYFNFAAGLTMTNTKFHNLFGAKPRQPETNITKREMDLASSIQVVIEELLIKISKYVKETYDVDSLCLAGGVALNCVANGKLLRENIFNNIWIQPAAGDAGGAIGAALSIYHEYLKGNRNVDSENDSMNGMYLGPSFSNNEIEVSFKSLGANYKLLENDGFDETVADLLSAGSVIGWFQGRMEFGPRALGARSIIADPRSQNMQSIMNKKIKYRESFRPFAPSIKFEKVSEWFELSKASPYMMFVAKVKKDKCTFDVVGEEKLFGVEKLKMQRSEIPAVTHVDYSARIQTVHKETNPRFWRVLDKFEQKTGCPVVVNTSFNVRGEPIVCTPEDAFRCFMRTDMDYLLIGDILLNKKEQRKQVADDNWKNQFELD